MRGSSGSRRLTGGGRCVEEEFPSDIGFSVGRGETSGEEEVVEGGFPGGEFPGKSEFCDRESAFDSTSLSLRESQTASRLNRQCQ